MAPHHFYTPGLCINQPSCTPPDVLLNEIFGFFGAENRPHGPSSFDGTIRTNFVEGISSYTHFLFRKLKIGYNSLLSFGYVRGGFSSLQQRGPYFFLKYEIIFGPACIFTIFILPCT
jgi:hypothetical protein